MASPYPKAYPTPWQKKILWSAITAVAIAFIGAVAAGVIVGTGRVLGFLQPLLIPVAAAGIFAYLLNPLVEKLVKMKMQRGSAVLTIFGVVSVLMIAIALWIVPEIYQQSSDFAEKLPGYIGKGRDVVTGEVTRAVEWLRVRFPGTKVPAQITDWAQKQLPELPLRAWKFISGGVQGFLGAAGFLLGLVMVPIYLYYFLMNSEPISKRWGDYLPLRASPFKDEVVDCLTEINSYLIAFFRGQILVTLIDGALIGISLLVMGLNFALLIGLMVAVLQLIPYVGAFLCWIPAVVIAFAQFADFKHPLYVTLIFFAVFQFEGFVLAPKIVGKSVGLHPMTIILSMFAWSLLVGGLLGALLAVPLTATLKVLLRRYVWQKQFEKLPEPKQPSGQ